MITKAMLLAGLKGCVVTDCVPMRDGTITLAFKPDRAEPFPGLTDSVRTFIEATDNLFVLSLAMNAKSRVAVILHKQPLAGDSDKTEDA